MDGHAGPVAPATTPLGAVLGGLVAGSVGTAAMDALLFARYRRSGGTSPVAAWEFSGGVTGWADAPAPAQVGKRLVEGLFQCTLPESSARLVNNVTHWAFGVASAVPFAVVQGSTSRPRTLLGLPFGAFVWAGGYVVLPAAKLYRPIWDYDARTLARDLAAHLVYGMTTSAVFTALVGTRRLRDDV